MIQMDFVMSVNINITCNSGHDGKIYESGHTQKKNKKKTSKR